MIIDIFKTNKYDNKTAVMNGNKSYTLSDIKSLIGAEIENIKNKKENIVILGKDNFSFIIEFFAALFCNKNIYLISDKSKINDLKIDFDILNYEEKEGIKNYVFPEININKPSVKFYTSGSTGSPKLIQKSFFNLIEEGSDIGRQFNFEKNLKIISTTTMCHLFGLTFHLMVPLINGLIIDTKKVSYPENIDEENIVLISTPSFLSSIPKYDIQFKIPPKYIISAGSKLENNIFKFLENNSKIIEIYGSTETGVIAHKTHYENDFTLFDNVCIKVNEKNVEVVSDYIYGKKAITNDKIELKDRTLKIKNRTDRLFKIYEKRISADEVELKLKDSEFVQNCYIDKIDNKLACFCALSNSGKKYILEKGVPFLTKELKNYLLKYFEIVPQKWKFIDEIPMTKAGKIDKKLIKHIFNLNLSLPVILDRKISKDSIIYEIFFHKQCNFFKGHFDQFKILAGVVQIYFAKEFINYHFNLEVGVGQFKRIKFSNLIKADSVVKLKLQKNDKNVSYEFYSDSEKYSSGVFLCENIFEGII